MTNESIKAAFGRFWEHVLNKLDSKVEKEDGKGLSSNDFTNEYKEKLDNVESSDLTYTEYVESVEGEPPVIDPVVQSAINNAVTDLKANISQIHALYPEENDSVASALAWLAENGDTTKVYVLPDGYVYGHMFKEGTGLTPNFVNQIPVSKGTDGKIYNGVGYKNDTRLNSSKVEATLEGAGVSGYIPVANGSVVRLAEGLCDTDISGAGSYNTVLYNSSFTALSAETLYQFGIDTTGLGFKDIVTDDNGYLTQFTIDSENAAYLRITFTTNITDTDTQIVTVNEEITYTTSEGGYQWASTMIPYMAHDYQNEIIELTEETTDHETRLKLLEANMYTESDIPKYWLEELETKVEAIQLAMETAGRNKSAFLWYTDAHWVNNAKMSPVLLKYLEENTPMNKTNFGGDIVGDPATFTHENIEYVYDWRKRIVDLSNHHSVTGNHDLNHRTTDVINMAYSFLIAPEESADMVVGDEMYYYIDNPAEKTRYLYLSYMTNDHTAMMEQGKFIVDAIKSVEEGWHIVAINHRWFQYTSSKNPTVGSIPVYEADILSIFDAYNARTNRADSNYFYAQDFTDAKGKVEFCIGGHIHVDYDFASEGGIPVIITTADTNQERVPDSAVDSGTVGTITESAVYGIIADYTDAENTKITVVGVGRGTSRVIKANDIKPTSISNITYSGDTTVGTTLDKSKFSFTVNYSNGTSESVTGATSVSPTTIEVVGNNTITVTYTEGTATLSGTVNVVGTEVPVANLLNLNRNYVSGTVGENIGNHFDENKAYLNVPYTNGVFYDGSCTVSNITEDSITIKEPGVGGICVAYPVELPNFETKSYKLSFDYASAASSKTRVYWRGVYPHGELAVINTLCNSGSGESGRIDAEITNTDGYVSVVVFFGSNTGGTTTFSNVSLTEM